MTKKHTTEKTSKSPYFTAFCENCKEELSFFTKQNGSVVCTACLNELKKTSETILRTRNTKR